MRKIISMQFLQTLAESRRSDAKLTKLKQLLAGPHNSTEVLELEGTIENPDAKLEARLIIENWVDKQVWLLYWGLAKRKLKKILIVLIIFMFIRG